MSLRAYHSTSPDRARRILAEGFRIPRTIEEAATDGQVGAVYPAIFFARKPAANYGPTIIEVQLVGPLGKLMRSRRGEKYIDLFARSLERAHATGKIGVDTGWETGGIAIIEPSAIVIEGLYRP